MKNINLLTVDSLEFDKCCKVFLQNHSNFSETSFLQSTNWAEIQKKYGRKVYFVVFKRNNEIISLAVLIELKIKFIKYFYIPRGPIFCKKISSADCLEILRSLTAFSKKNRASFFRFEPLNFVNNNSVKKVKDVQPSKTVYLNLEKSENELLAKMKQKTRYNINLSNRKDLKFAWQKNTDLAYCNFIKLLKITSLRDDFFTHNNDYYKNLINYNSDFIKVFEVYYQDQVLVSGIFSFFNNSVSYLHGASNNEYRNLMASHFFQMEVIKLSKKEGYKFYDFYGIDEKKFSGVSKFKIGFGGEIFNYPGTFDRVVNKFYYFVYDLFRSLKNFYGRCN